MKICLLLLALGFFIMPVEAKTVGKASFVATTSGGFDVKGEGAPVDADVKHDGGKVSGTFIVTLKDLKTGMDLRDTHMCDALECGKFPKAKFILPAMDAKDGEQSVTGSLELHGVTKPFTGAATFKGSQVSFHGKLKASDFGLKLPDYKLVKVNDEIEVTVDLAI